MAEIQSCGQLRQARVKLCFAIVNLHDKLYDTNDPCLASHRAYIAEGIELMGDNMKKVLLASSSSGFLSRNKDLLMQTGMQLFTATSGAETLKLHAEHLFDLILSDFELEDMDGCTLCSLVGKGKNSRYVPVILFCHNQSGIIAKVEQSGASAMLLKPIDPTQLLKTIGRFTGMQLVRSKRVLLQVSVLSRKQDLEFSCLSHDISSTGILVETENELALGSRVFCHFTLPDVIHVEAEGEIIRCMHEEGGRNLYGVKFIHMPLSYRKAIDEYIDSAENLTSDNPPKKQNIYPFID